MFRNREEAGGRLAEALRERELRDPLVLAIPRGGVAVGAALARGLGAELDVVLSRKLRAPGQPELALGAISEDGSVYLDDYGEQVAGALGAYLRDECRFQMREIARRARLFRAVRLPSPVAGRSVIVTDDGIATGSTMIAALQSLRGRGPQEMIVAVPVASPDRLEEVRRWCDDAVCLHCPADFWSVGAWYDDFTQVEDDEVRDLLREAAAASRPAKRVRDGEAAHP